MKIESEFNDLVGSLYEGILEHQPWQNFLSRVRELLGAHLVTLVLRPPGGEDNAVMLADGGSLSAIKSYNEGQFVLDPFVNLPSKEVLTLHNYLSSESLQASEFYRIIMQPQGWYDFLGVDIREEGELDLRFRVGRYKGAKRFGKNECALIEALLPHLERAVRLHTKLNRTERERAVYAGAVEQMAVATIILDEQGNVVSTNSAAEQLLAVRQGLCVKGNALEFDDKKTATEFKQLVDDVMSSRRQRIPGAAAALQIPRGVDLPDLGMVARAVNSASVVDGSSIPSIALFISDPDQVLESHVKVVARLFGFTPTEAGLAMLLANGLTLDEASEQLGVSRNTTRTHLRAVFAKTGVTRQTGLVRLILQSVAPLAGDSAL